MICKICNKQFKNFISLANHIRYKHKEIGNQGYYDLFLKIDQNEGICKNPNCSNNTTYCGLNEGYAQHCSGRCKCLDPEVKEKMEKTLFKNHGVKHALQSKVILKRMEENNLKKYGKKNQMQRLEIVEKSKKTCLEKYGVDNINKLEESKARISKRHTNRFVSEETRKKLKIINTGIKRSKEFKEKRRQYMLNGGAVHCNTFIKNPSRPQKLLFDIVKTIFSTAIINYPLVRGLGKSDYSLDIAIPQIKLVIEYDGSYWHKDKKRDNQRQTDIESLGWEVIRYTDIVPTKDQIIKDMNKFLFLNNN